MSQRYRLVTVHGEAASLFHVVDGMAPEPEQPKIIHTHASKPSADAEADELNGAQTRFIKALADFNGAAHQLTQAWEHYELTTGEVVPNGKYPLPVSFDEWALSLWEWADDVYTKMGEQP